MCTVSMIGDHYGDKFRHHPMLPSPIGPGYTFTPNQVSRAEFEELRKDVLEMKQLLKRAVEYDKNNNEPHCEQEEKIALLKRVAELVGVKLDDVLK